MTQTVAPDPVTPDAGFLTIFEDGLQTPLSDISSCRINTEEF
jgi:hypothetical protein